MPAGGSVGKGTDWGISEASAMVTAETETFWGDKFTVGAIGQLLEADGTKGKVVRVQLPFLAGWVLGTEERAPTKGLAVVVGVEVSLSVVGATPTGPALSKGTASTVGAVTELLRNRLVESGLAQTSVLTTENGELTPREAAVAPAGSATGRGPIRLFFVTVAPGEVISRDDILWTEEEFLGGAEARDSRSVGSFLVGSPPWAGERGAPTFTNTEVGRNL